MARTPAGILLAAGRGSRFDPDGGQDKLLALLPAGIPVAVASARNLLAALGHVVAVVRPGKPVLAGALRDLGCEVVECPDASQGIAHSLAYAVSLTAGPWIVALADMPRVKPSTMQCLCGALEHGAAIAAPVYQGKRGNPVAFAAANRSALLALQGDQGARSLVNTDATVLVQVDDPGILFDVDQVSDLR